MRLGLLLALAASAATLRELEAEAERSPAAILARDFANPHLADRLHRIAFEAALQENPEAAQRHIGRVIGRPWVGHASFHAAVALAHRLAPPDARALLMAVATRQPNLTVREVETYRDLDSAREVFARAASIVPEETAGIARGTSPTAAMVREFARTLTLPPPASSEGAAFEAIVERRLRAEPADWPALDRHLESYATPVYRSGQFSKLSPRGLYWLLVSATEEDDDEAFGALLDKYLLARLSDSFFESMGEARLRDFLVRAIIHQRLEVVLRRAPSALGQAFRGIATVEDAAAAAEIQMARRPPRNVLDGDPHLLALLEAGLHGERQLDVRSMFPREVCVQRHLFHDDDDGVESFESFRRGYSNDARWQWREQDGWVCVVGRSGNRRIEIHANVPIDLGLAGNAARRGEAEERQRRVTHHLEGREISVLVHRGHTFHLPKSLEFLTVETRLVYLGNCLGLPFIDTVVRRSPRAQLVLTRRVGTWKLNDPLLKAINDKLLDSRDSLDWPAFWRSQQARLGADSRFASYVPPHANATALFLRAFYESLLRNSP